MPLASSMSLASFLRAACASKILRSSSASFSACVLADAHQVARERASVHLVRATLPRFNIGWPSLAKPCCTSGQHLATLSTYRHSRKCGTTHFQAPASPSTREPRQARTACFSVNPDLPPPLAPRPSPSSSTVSVGWSASAAPASVAASAARMAGRCPPHPRTSTLACRPRAPRASA